MDGDALIMPMRRWEWLLANISTRLPWVERVATYANAKSVEKKPMKNYVNSVKWGYPLFIMV